MADTPKEEATTPVPEYNAEQALKEALEADTLESEETDISEAVTADEDQAEETESNDEEEDPTPPTTEEDEDTDLPQLDEIILKALGDNTEAKQAWERQWKGVEKRERKLAEREEAIQTDEKGYQVYQSYAEAFSDPERWQAAYEALGKSLGQAHNQTPAQEAKEVDNGWEYDGKLWASETEIELYKEVQALKAAKPQEDPFIAQLKAEREAEKEERAISQWVDSNQPRITSKVAAKTGGWGVTKEMVAEVAKTNREGLEKDPVAAMQKAFPIEWGDFRASTAKPKVRDMLSNTEAKGFTVPENPDEYSAAHALMELGS